MARSFVRDTLREWGYERHVDEAAVITSELVTNAVVHAGTPIAVTVSVQRGVVSIEVCDHDPRPPTPRSGVRRADTSGRGLILVDGLASRWGADVHDNVKRIWAELPSG